MQQQYGLPITVTPSFQLSRRKSEKSIFTNRSPTIVGCLLWYPIAISTMKPEVRLLSSEISILVFREKQKLFLKFRAPRKEQDRSCCLARYYLELMELKSTHSNKQMIH